MSRSRVWVSFFGNEEAHNVKMASNKKFKNQQTMQLMMYLTGIHDYNTWVERFNVQGSGLMNPNRLNPKELRLHRGSK